MFYNQDLNPEYLTKKYKKFVYSQHKFTTPSGNFVNKFNAYDAVNGVMNDIQFNVDPAWGDIDFSKPPKINYFELVKQRARHIRQNYEYIRFWLSGGSDSYTALWGFIESGTKIDEIIVVRKFLQSPDELNSFEENTTVKKILEYYSHQLKHTKITYLDYDWHFFKKTFSCNEHNWINWTFGHCPLSIRVCIDHANPFFKYPDLLNLFDQNVRVADVCGLEKSKVYLINGERFHLMLDASKMAGSCGRPGHVPFYFDHEFPELFVLDAHLRYANSPTRVPHPFYNAVSHRYNRKYNKHKCFAPDAKNSAFELECSLNRETSELLDLFYSRMDKLCEKYSALIREDWVVSEGVHGHFGLASSLDRNYRCMHYELPSAL